MASKKAISYQWRLFLPVLLCFWVILISMAVWQLYRVHEVKQDMVDDQLELVGERIAAFYENPNLPDDPEDFMRFINKFYTDSRRYDPMTVLVRDNEGHTVISFGVKIPEDIEIPVPEEEDAGHGKFKYSGKDLDDSSDDITFLYYVRNISNGYTAYVLLPYTKVVELSVSASTTRFWLIFFTIAVFITVMAYISSQYFSKNIRILRDFANKAADDPDFVATGMDFPHDEMGDISRKIISIYNQRIKEMERREKEHKVALNAIEDKERMKRELTGNINHELKTPVGVIQGYLDTIVDDPDMTPETRERFLKKAQQNVHRLTALIADITAITKLDSGGKLVNVEEADFHDLVFKLDNYVTENKLLGKMKFFYDIPLRCKVVGNDSLLTSVILNFIKNSVAYSQGKECHLNCIGEDDKMYYFTFYDDGIGVPPEHLPHMFERFYRVNAGRSRETGGTGLGLSIVEVTITTLGGTIDVQNRLPRGLEYHFSLPKWGPKGPKKVTDSETC